MWKGCHSCHKRYDMQKQHRIGNRIVGHLDVQTTLVVQRNPLLQQPETIGNCQEYPEWPATQRVLYSVANGKTGRQKQEKEITDPAVRNQERSRFYGERKDGLDDYNCD